MVIQIQILKSKIIFAKLNIETTVQNDQLSIVDEMIVTYIVTGMQVLL